MKALVSAFTLLAFVAGTAVPTQTFAQAAGTGQTTAAPETSAPAAPTTTHKRRHSSRSHHAKKKSKKSSTSQTSSVNEMHAGHSVS